MLEIGTSGTVRGEDGNILTYSAYGMIGGIEETSASFEARSAPRSYPTNWFTEGFDAPVLKEAKALLQELST
jgi:hypothetical protein